MAEPAQDTTGIPKQALEAAEMAEDLHAKMFGKETPKEPETPAPTPSGEEPGKTPPEAPKEGEKPKEGDTPPVEPQAKEGEPPPEPQNFEAKYQELLKEHETLTQQHKTLKGKYDKEVPHNASRADRLANELAEFKGQVMERLGRMADGKETPAVASEEDQELVEKAERLQSQYGDEYTDMLRAFMLREIQPLLRDTVKPVEDSVHTVQDAQALVNEQTFIKAVNENLGVEADWVEDWRNEGSNPDFEAFLDQPDPSGIYTNRQLADIFNENHDGARFATLLGQFYKKPEATPPEGKEPKKETAAAPEPPPAKKEEPAKEPPTGQQHMIAPDASQPTATPETTEGKIIWTQETMDAFYEKDRKGGYSEEESQRLWNDLLMAPAEGRIQPRQISQ